MIRRTFTFTFVGPVATAGEIHRDLGVDRPMARNAFDRFVLPATLIKGAIREALDQVASLALPGNAPPPRLGDLLFGVDRRPGALVWTDAVLDVPGSTPAAATTPAPSASLPLLQPDDLKIVPAPAGPAADLPVQSQVAIDRRFGRARDEALAFREGPGYGETTTWSGTVDIPEGGIAGLSAADVETLLLLALHWLDALGTDSGVGWGWIAECRFADKPLPAPPADPTKLIARALTAAQVAASAVAPASAPAVSAPAVPVQWLEVAVVLHGPLLVGDTPRPENFRAATPYIPGAALKRALADVLLAAAGAPRNGWVEAKLAVKDQDLAPFLAVFNDLQVRHALPVPIATLRAVAGGGAAAIPRPLAVPLTALKTKSQNGVRPMGDAFVAELRNQPVFHTPPDRRDPEERLQLALEWLDRPAWACASNVADPRRIARTRTAIDPTTRRADDQKLFTYLALDPVLGPLVDPEAPPAKPNAAATAQAAVTAEPATVTTLVRQTFVTRIGIPQNAEPKTLAALKTALARVRTLGKSTTSGFGAVRLYELAGSPAAADLVREFDDRVRDWKAAFGGEAAAAGLFPVVLNTDALLLPPFDAALTQGVDLLGLYEEAWQALVAAAEGPAVSLHPDFGVVASHVLRGAVGSDPAHGRPLAVPPVVLTRAGSAFLLTCAAGDEGKLRKALETLSRTGLERLDLLKTVAKCWGRACPYRTTNGYGEIIVCHPLHAGEKTR